MKKTNIDLRNIIKDHMKKININLNILNLANNIEKIIKINKKNILISGMQKIMLKNQNINHLLK
jgi:uncharacterized protein YbcV (DUF1398 family)